MPLINIPNQEGISYKLICYYKLPMVSSTIKNGVIAGVLGAVSVVLFTAFGWAAIGQPEKVLQTGCQIYMGWVAGGIFILSLLGAVLYDSIPGSTPRAKAVSSSVLGVPIYLSGLLLPMTRPLTAPYATLPGWMTMPANISFFVIGSLLSMGIVMYKFNDLQQKSAQGSQSGVPA